MIDSIFKHINKNWNFESYLFLIFEGLRDISFYYSNETWLFPNLQSRYINKILSLFEKKNCHNFITIRCIIKLSIHSFKKKKISIHENCKLQLSERSPIVISDMTKRSKTEGKRGNTYTMTWRVGIG